MRNDDNDNTELAAFFVQKMQERRTLNYFTAPPVFLHIKMIKIYRNSPLCTHLIILTVTMSAKNEKQK